MATKCIIDLGPGDGRKTIIPVYNALKSGRYESIAIGLVDCSLDMLDTSENRIRSVVPGAMRTFHKDVAYKMELKRFHERFEDLKDDASFKRFIKQYGEREFLFYGTTAGNFDPPKAVEILYDNMLSGDRVQVGLQLYRKGHDDAMLKAYGSELAKEVSFVGLKELGFADGDDKAMKYYAEITKREFDEFKEMELGSLTVVKTIFEARTPMQRELVTLTAGQPIQATSSIKYTKEQARKVFTYKGKFKILDIFEDDDTAIFWMERK